MRKLFCALLALTLLLTACASVAEDQPTSVTVLVAEALGDRSFNDSANEGLQALIADYGVTGSVVECKNDASKFLPALADAADASDVIVAVGWQFWDALTEVVPEYPDKQFIFVDNPLVLEGCGNLVSVIYADHQGSFLAGYIAMKMSKTGKVGVIGGEDSETINNFIVGYKQGALYANPDGEVADAMYTDTYDDPAKGKEYALALYGAGCDVVYQVAAKTGLGVFEAAQETGNYAIGVDSDQKYINPEAIICSMVKRVGLSIYDTVAGYLAEGTLPGGGAIVEAGMHNGYIGIGYGDETMTQQVPDELKAEVEALAQKIISGEIVVDTTR